MLVLKRREGQWTDVVHESSGDVLRIRVCQIEGGFPGHLNLAFDDSARNFSIERPERNKQRPVDASVVIPVDPKYYDPDKR